MASARTASNPSHTPTSARPVDQPRRHDDHQHTTKVVPRSWQRPGPFAVASDKPNNAVIGDRSFSNDPQTVTRYADAFAQGLNAAGVLPVFKHFPGHGRATGDSHRGPVSTPPLTELRDVDLLPYRQLLDGQPAAVMVGHLNVPTLTEAGTSASISLATSFASMAWCSPTISVP